MARLARVVVPDLPHHVTQRGNRRERVFFEEGDYSFYLDLIAQAAKGSKTTIAGSRIEKDRASYFTQCQRNTVMA